MHVAFGITYPIGMDVMSFLFERVAAEPEFRANLPRPDGPDAAPALSARLSALSDRIRAVLAEPRTAAQIASLQRGFRYPRHAYALPDLLAEPADDRFRVRAKGIRMVQQNGRYGLVQEGSRAATEVPAEVGPLVRWVLERREFSRDRAGGGVSGARRRPARPAAARPRRHAPDRAPVSALCGPLATLRQFCSAFAESTVDAAAIRVVNKEP